MSDNNSHQRPWRVLVTTMAAAGVLGMAGCTDENSGNPQDAWSENGEFVYEGNAPKDIAQESASSYDDNVNGLISGSTLDSWINDWSGAKSSLSGVGGDLVILQVSTGATDNNGTPDDDSDDETVYHYIDGSGDSAVRVYAIDTSRLVETRSNGVMASRSMVPTGSRMDGFLRDYDIDPTNDMVVWAMGAGGAGNAMRQGRGWYMMRYWGTPKENLAILNGGVNHSAVMSSNVVANTDQDTAITNAGACDENVDAACLPGGGSVSVADLPEDNLALQATQQDVMATARGDVDAFVWDARSEGEYMGTAFRTGGKQGHPKGAAFLSYSNLLMTDDADANNNNYGASYRYKPRIDLADYMLGREVDGARFQRSYSGSLGQLQNGDIYSDGQTVITYCETTFRAMITGIASGVVLGQPTRFYDGAMTEWNHMAHIQTKDGEFLLPSQSPWRTDNGLSFFKYRDPADTERHPDATLDDPYASNTNAIIEADRAYRSGGSGSGGGSGGDSGDDGGGAPVANPCGG